MANRSWLDDPNEGEARREMLAQLYVDGYDRPYIANTLGRHVDTITAWVHRADVQSIITRLNNDRANRIVRKVDSVLEARLIEGGDRMDTKTLLEVRKTISPSAIRIEQSITREDAVDELTKQALADLESDLTEAAEDERDTEVEGARSVESD